MKRWILSLALLTLGFTASAQNDLIDRGELAPEIAAASGEKMEWLPSFNGVIVEGLFRIRFERVPMDQAPKIVFNTKGVYDSGTDQRVDFSAGDEVHQLAKQNAACSTYAERNKTERDDEQCVDLEEVLGNCGSADSNAEEDRDNVHKFVCSCLYETFANAYIRPTS